MEWPDIVASDVVLKRIAVGLAIASSLLLASSAGLFLHVPWAVQAALLALLIFVSGGFWGNYAAFGEFRRMHIGTNIIVAAIIVVLLWLSAGTPT